jgi:hypothetical protein
VTYQPQDRAMVPQCGEPRQQKLGMPIFCTPSNVMDSSAAMRVSARAFIDGRLEIHQPVGAL